MHEKLFFGYWFSKAFFFISFVLTFLLPRSLHILVLSPYLELTSRLILTVSLLQTLGSALSFVEENLRTLPEWQAG